MLKYYVAIPEGALQDSWHILDEFEAASDVEANKYAEANWAHKDWYVLNANMENINSSGSRNIVEYLCPRECG